MRANRCGCVIVFVTLTGYTERCPNDATQEDLLCDGCREHLGGPDTSFRHILSLPEEDRYEIDLGNLDELMYTQPEK